MTNELVGDKETNQMRTPSEVVGDLAARKDPRLLPKYRVIPTFPDYMINKQGTVRHLDTHKYCLFLRLTSSGGCMIMLQKDGKPHHTIVQSLVAITFG